MSHREDSFCILVFPFHTCTENSHWDFNSLHIWALFYFVLSGFDNLLESVVLYFIIVKILRIFYINRSHISSVLLLSFTHYLLHVN